MNELFSAFLVLDLYFCLISKHGFFNNYVIIPIDNINTENKQVGNNNNYKSNRKCR